MDTDAPTSLIYLSPERIRLLKGLALAFGATALVASFAGRRLGWLDYRPGGASFDALVHPVVAVAYAVALVVAVRWQILGGAIAGFAGAALITFAFNQLEPLHAAIMVAAFAIPGLLWLVIDMAEFSRSWGLIAVAVTSVVTVAGFIVGQTVYERFWGPTHPESAVEELPESAVQWVWTGAVSPTTAEVRAKPTESTPTTARLLVSPSTDSTGLADPADGFWYNAVDASAPVLRFPAVDLEPATTYHYAIEIDGELDTVRDGRFTTFPTGPGSFTVAIGSCARVGSNGAVFDAIRENDPLIYIVPGDLHYGDNERNDLDRYRDVLDLTLSRPGQAALYRTTPIAYVWDDHDYGPNDADFSSPSRQAAMLAYREYVPSYDLAGEQTAVYQSFSIGRVRFILTDARASRDLEGPEVDGDKRSMLGDAQKAWLKNELTEAADSHALVVWVNPVPWVTEAEDGGDHWGGFAAERRELANHIADNNIDNLLMVSGDAHMVAIDDGTNTNFADDSDGESAFPLIHAAALDRPGSSKGGPYTEGFIAGGGQFATVDIDDRGDEVSVRLTARNWTNDVLLDYSVAVAVDVDEQ